MPSKPTSLLIFLASMALAGISGAAQAQETATTESEAQTAEEQAEQEELALLNEEELDELVGPIALYPDTLLIQVLVAATYPVEVIRADRFVSDNADMAPEELVAAIEEQAWDPSVVVLAQGFPTVLANMAEHLDWTELAGNAMLAQSEDVMDAVQRMREQAEEFDNLETNEQQVVSRDETDSIVILPADPEVIYVPTYDYTKVYHVHQPYVQPLFWVTVGVIWGRNSYWGPYWGCRNCGGWGGRPIHTRPVNIDINGNVNIGNDINIGRGNGSWNPDPVRRDRARNDINDRKLDDRRGGKTDRPLARDTGGRGDQMRRDLSNQTGARDISRPSGGDRTRPEVNRPSTGNNNRPATRPSTGNKPKPSARPSTGNRAQPATRPSTNRKPSAATRSAPSKKNVAKPSKSRQPSKATRSNRSSSAFQSNGGGKAARSSRQRGSASRKQAPQRRR